jgi:hypothetical protein
MYQHLGPLGRPGYEFEEVERDLGDPISDHFRATKFQLLLHVLKVI